MTKKLKIIMLALGIGFVAMTITSVIFFIELSNTNSDPQAVAQAQADAIIKEAGKLIVLPQDETPSVVKITDPTKLQGQVFFQDAKTGDYVLLYYSEKKAVLYDPAQNKIINIAPFNVDGSQSSSTSGS